MFGDTPFLLTKISGDGCKDISRTIIAFGSGFYHVGVTDLRTKDCEWKDFYSLANLLLSSPSEVQDPFLSGCRGKSREM